MTSKRKKFLISAVALASVLILVGVGLAEATDVVIYQKDTTGDGYLDLWKVNADGMGAVNLTNSAGVTEKDPHILSNGKKVVYARYDGSNYQIYIRNVSDIGGAGTQLTTGSNSKRHPAVSNDRSKIVWSEQNGSNWEIHIATLDAQNNTISGGSTLTSGSNDQYPDINLAKDTVVFSRFGSGNLWRICTVPAAGGSVTEQAFTSGIVPDLDPAFKDTEADSQAIVFTRGNAGSQEIYTAQIGGAAGSAIQLTTGDANGDQYSPSYATGGNTVVFTSCHQEASGGIYYLTGAGNSGTWRQIVQTTRTEDYGSWGPAWVAPTAVTDLQTTPTCTPAVLLTWTDNSLVEENVVVKRGDGTNTPTLATLPENSTSYTDVTPLPDTVYTYEVYAVNDAGPSAAATQVCTTAITTAPTLSLTSKDTDEITVEWTDPAATELGFSLEWAADSTFGNILGVIGVSANDTTATVQDLTKDTDYCFRVAAYNNLSDTDGCGWSNTLCVTTCDTTPNDPSIVSATASGTTITVIWNDNSDNEEGFEVRRVSEGGSDTTTLFANAGDTTYVDSGLNEDTIYTYDVRAYTTRACGGYDTASVWSSTASDTTVPKVPGWIQADTEGVAAENYSNTVHVSWGDSSNHETAQELVWYKQSDPANTSSISVDPNDTDEMVSGLDKDTTYCFKVRAINEAGMSAFVGPVCWTTSDTVPTAPEDLAGTATTCKTFAITFTDSSTNETSFVIERWSDAGNTQTFTVPAAAGSGSTVSYTDTYDTECSCTVYSYRVKAVNSFGDSSWSTGTLVNGVVTSLFVDAPRQVIQGSNLATTINISCGAVNLDVITFQLNYDTNLFNVLNVTNGSSLANDSVSLTVNTTVPGQLTVVWNPINVIGFNCEGDTPIVNVTFSASSTNMGTSCLDLVSATATNTGAQTFVLTGLVDDCVEVVSINLVADVTCDGIINALDITALERLLLGLASPCMVGVGDVNGDRVVNALDITALERVVAGLPPLPAPARIPSIESVKVNLGTRVEQGKMIVTLSVDQVKDLDVVQLDLDYDATKLQIDRISLGEVTGEAKLLSNTMEDGKVRILLNVPGLTGVDGSGSLLVITFDGVGSRADFSVNNLLMGDIYATAIPIDMMGATPLKSRLLQSYPNPLNPEAWLPFELSESADVTINIYSLSGQLIRALPLGVKPAGSYLTKEAAAYWDGKDFSGQEVSSGVYLYQIKAGGFTSTRKMIVLK